MNDDKTKELTPIRKTPMERLGENLEVLKVDFGKMKVKQGDEALRLKKANTAIDQLRYDLADPKREYGYTPTREVAVAALEQAKGFISTENLEGHQVIKDLKESIESYLNTTANKYGQLSRLVKEIPSPDNMQDLLNENFTFKELREKVGSLGDYRTTCRDGRQNLKNELNAFKETYNGNDHPTGPEFDELKSDYAELIHKFNCIINYIVGYTTGKDSETSAHILKAYEHTPKKE